MENTTETGRKSEDMALRYLEAIGWAVLERNFRCRRGEIDIVARDGETVVFVEVRSRRKSGFGTAAETVGRVKRARLVYAARVWTAARRRDQPMRFDVIAVDEGRLSHIADAFRTD
jgi:putative endonuclease